jgi:Zn ribbon nucleic-acid-binding protein
MIQDIQNPNSLKCPRCQNTNKEHFHNYTTDNSVYNHYACARCGYQEITAFKEK